MTAIDTEALKPRILEILNTLTNTHDSTWANLHEVSDKIIATIAQQSVPTDAAKKAALQKLDRLQELIDNASFADTTNGVSPKRMSASMLINSIRAALTSKLQEGVKQ